MSDIERKRPRSKNVSSRSRDQCSITAGSGPVILRGKRKEVAEQRGKGWQSKGKKERKRRTSVRSWVTLAGAYLVGVRAAGTLGLRLTAYATELRGWGRRSDLVVMSRGGRAARRREKCGEGACWRSPSGRRTGAGPCIVFPLFHTCMIHVWYSGREKEIILSRSHPN